MCHASQHSSCQHGTISCVIHSEWVRQLSYFEQRVGYVGYVHRNVPENQLAVLPRFFRKHQLKHHNFQYLHPLV